MSSAYTIKDYKNAQYMGYIREKGNGIYREVGGFLILGASRPIFIHNGNYYLTELKIYADRMVDCWGLITFDLFKEKVKSGWVVTELPKTAEVSMFPLGGLTATNFRGSVKSEELIKEVADTINELNGKPSTSDLCREAYEKYQKEPTEVNKSNLQALYEAVPEHNRIFILGDQGHKDNAIRSILYQE